MSIRGYLAVLVCLLATLINLGVERRGADAAPALQLPHPTGVQAKIDGGYTYGCGDHTGLNAWAIDFWLNPALFYAVPRIPQPVSTVASGTVVASSFAPDAGWFVDVDHGAGYVSHYTDLDGQGLGNGTFVAQGQTIGNGGSSGSASTGPHLHFRILASGSPYKPEPMSGVRNFGNYGVSATQGCTGNNVSPWWVSRHPYDVQKVTDSKVGGGADAVVFWESTGNWRLAPAAGGPPAFYFGTDTQWRGGHGANSNRQFAANMDNANGTDAVVYYGGDGSWWVAKSNGSTGYLTPTRWALGESAGPAVRFLADVNWDGKADAVVFFPVTGQWYVGLANAASTQFGAFTQWATGHGVGSIDQLLADVSGDGRADAIVYFDTCYLGPDAYHGCWYVAKANTSGNGFEAYSLWAIGHGWTSDNRLVADVNGDGKQDPVVFFGSNGQWSVALSNGAGFLNATTWAMGHGSNSDNQMLADATGDGKADAVVYFNRSGPIAPGSWYAAPSNGSIFSPIPTPSAPWRTGFGCCTSPNDPS